MRQYGKGINDAFCSVVLGFFRIELLLSDPNIYEKIQWQNITIDSKPQ